MKETKTEHFYFFYSIFVRGYGPSMDPHRCGHPDEPCVTITYEREVTDWKVSGIEKRGFDGDVPQD